MGIDRIRIESVKEWKAREENNVMINQVHVDI
jgi:hypothetical protein